ncbi:MAG: COG1361 S-layer family protein [Nanoarchaeota archaeon]|nr:COG1361 S-layer family protein [Nanoarchaeota archaeon]
MKEILFGMIVAVLLFTPTAMAASVDIDFVNQFPDPAKAGGSVDLRLLVSNTGSTTAKNIIVEFLPAFPFTLVSDQNATRTITTLPAVPDEAAEKILLYTVLVDSAAPDGLHEIKYRYTTDNGNTWFSSTADVYVATKEYAQIIYIDKSKITPGKETNLTFTITNIGNAPLSNIVFSWTEAADVVLPVNTDNTRYISHLAAGASTDLVYTIIANPTAVRGLYTLDLTLTFDTKDETGAASSDEIVTKAGVLVGGGTNFDIALSETSSGQVSLSVANIGENDATSVTMTIPKQTGVTLTGGSSAIIGNLNTGDFTIATFSLTTQGTAELLVNISYTDSFGERNTVQKTVVLEQGFTAFGNTTQTDTTGAQRLNRPGGLFGTGQTNTSGIMTSVTSGIVVLVVAIAMVIMYRRRKKGKWPFRKKK